jgi:hypothetical protein
MKNHITQVAAIAAMAFAMSPTWAINKCTGPGGAVVYQDAPCTPTASRSETVKSAAAMNAPPSKGWAYHRSVDNMTGSVTCFAESPVTYMQYAPARLDLAPVVMQVEILPGERVSVRVVAVGGAAPGFHADRSGMGVKAEPGGFYTVGIRGGQKVAGADDSGALTEALLSSQSIRIRAKFWPYDTLRDSPEIPMMGFKQAVAQAGVCAGQR